MSTDEIWELVTGDGIHFGVGYPDRETADDVARDAQDGEVVDYD